MKKILAMLLAVVMVLGLFTACGNTTPETTEPKSPEGTNPPESTPVEDETVDYVNAPDLSGKTIRILTAESGWTAEGYASLLPKFEQIEELTGCTIIWEAPAADWETLLQTRLAGDVSEAPDIIFNGGFKAPASQIEDGYLVAVSDYFDIAPGIAEWYVNNPNLAKQLTYTDGSIYTIPNCAFTSPEGFADYWTRNGEHTFWYRGDIAAELGFTEIPSTLEELEALLYAVKAAYPDMVPMAMRNLTGNSWAAARNFSASFGLHFNFEGGRNFYYPDENGVIQYEFISDEAILWMETMARWYKDGLIADTADWDAYYATPGSGTVFSAFWDGAYAQEELAKQTDPDAYFLYMPFVPAEGYEVVYTPRAYTNCSTQIVDNGDEERIEAAIQFLEFAFYSDYGVYSNQAGVMGEGWDFGENGEFVPNLDYVRSIVNDGVVNRDSGADMWHYMADLYDPEVFDIWMDAFDAVYAENGTSRIPNQATAESFEAALEYNFAHVAERFIEFYADEDDQEILDKYEYECYKYAALYSAAVIKGEKDLANVQTELIETLYNELHLQELIDLYQKYYDAYMAG